MAEVEEVETMVIACMPSSADVLRVAGAGDSTCEGCQGSIVVSPSSVALACERPPVIFLCIPCAMKRAQAEETRTGEPTKVRPIDDRQLAEIFGPYHQK